MEEKLLLADMIYQLHNKYSFRGEAKLWSSPFTAFSANTETPCLDGFSKFERDLKKKGEIL